MFCLATANPAAAEWSSDPNVNDLLLQPQDGTFLDTVTAPDGSGGILSAAFERENGTNDFFITVGRTDADGNSLFGLTGTRIPILGSNTLVFVDLEPDGTGGAFVAAWFQPSGGIFRRFLLYHVDDQGTLTSNPNGSSLTGTLSAQADLEMISDGAGGLLVAWSEDRGPTSDDIVVQRLNSNLFKLWGLAGIVLCSASGSQRTPVLTTDGAGGLIAAWTDRRSGNREVFVGRVESDGSQPWNANGVRLISSFSTSSPSPSIVSNGAGGAVVSALTFGLEPIGDAVLVAVDSEGNQVEFRELTRSDGFGQTDLRVIRDGSTGYFATWVEDPGSSPDRVRVQRLGGGLRTLWSSDVLAASSSLFQDDPSARPDGSGGVVVSWEENDGGPFFRAQRLDSSGARRWSTSGLEVTTGRGLRFDHNTIVQPDGSVFVAWEDRRADETIGVQIFAQRITPEGFFGDPRPVISTVADFPQDQGGVLRVDWEACELDDADQWLVSEYLVFRRLGDALMRTRIDTAAMARAAGLDAARAEALAAGGWEFLQSVEAFALPTYSLAAPSYGDATQTESPVTEFMVIARIPSRNALLESSPAGGTSVDNLAPGAPQALLAARESGAVELAWSAPLEPVEDLREYFVYRGTTETFPLGAASFVGTSSDTTLIESDPGPGPWYYRVTAIDVHDNESDASNAAAIDQATAAGDRPVTDRSALRGAHPNPFNPRTEIRFDVARSGPVLLEIFDVRGRKVARLADRPMDAGSHRVAWDGTGIDGRAVASGTYFVRFVTADGVDVSKAVLVK